MCEQEVRYYTCGCRKKKEFRQCAARAGTNVKCDPVAEIRMPNSTHMCSSHMVKPNKDEMRRRGGEASSSRVSHSSGPWFMHRNLSRGVLDHIVSETILPNYPSNATGSLAPRALRAGK
jgi:hypothetical protein